MRRRAVGVVVLGVGGIVVDDQDVDVAGFDDEGPDGDVLVAEATVKEEEFFVLRDAAGPREVEEGVAVEGEEVFEDGLVGEADDAFEYVGEGVVGAVGGREGFADGWEDVGGGAEDVAEVVVLGDTLAGVFGLAIVEVGAEEFDVGEGGEAIVPGAELVGVEFVLGGVVGRGALVLPGHNAECRDDREGDVVVGEVAE